MCCALAVFTLEQKMFFLTTNSIRKCDSLTLQNAVSGRILMERAGYGAFRFLTQIAFPGIARALVVCGKGNNAGDGYVIARYLSEYGCCVDLLQISSLDELKGDAAIQWQEMQERPVRISHCTDENAIANFLSLWNGDVIVDALLGTGIKGDVRGIFVPTINGINAHYAPVLAVDIPSGLNGDSGEPCGCAVKAQWTATFAHPKIGMRADSAHEFCGRIECIDIGIPDEISKRIAAEEKADVYADSAAEIARLLPERRFDSYKNSFGHLLIVAGSTRMSGAAALTGISALKTGAGLVTLAIPESIADRVAMTVPACMTLPLPDEGKGIIGKAARDVLAKELKNYDALAIGPGMGRTPETVKTVNEIIRKTPSPVVVDADALYALAQDTTVISDRAGKDTVLTPHPGECARLANTSAPSASYSVRYDAIRNLVKKYPCTIVLKGHHSLIATPAAANATTIDNNAIHLNLSGSAALATAGSGDVLTGVIAALLAAGLSAQNAAVAGCQLHGCAGDAAAGYIGSDGLTAEDISAYLPVAIRYARSCRAK